MAHWQSNRSNTFITMTWIGLKYELFFRHEIRIPTGPCQTAIVAIKNPSQVSLMFKYSISLEGLLDYIHAFLLEFRFRKDR